MRNNEKYLCSYMYKGERYSIELNAESLEEARDRLKFLKTNLILEGRIVFKFPSFLYPFVTALIKCKNFLLGESYE